MFRCIIKKNNVSKVRSIGSIAAFEYNNIDKKYGSTDGELLKENVLKNGLLLRPLGNTIYVILYLSKMIAFIKVMRKSLRS